MRFRPMLLAVVVASHAAAAGAPKPGKSTVHGARRATIKPARCEMKSLLARGASPRTTQRIRPLGEVSLVGNQQAWEGKVLTPKGHIIPSAREAISRLLGAIGARPAVPERLIHLLVQASDAFGGRPLRVVCGYRTTSYSPDSQHRHSAAIDFSVIGVRNAELRDYLLTLDDVGVGYYPNSSFVHLDVRKEKTYWLDYSGPGQPPRYSPRKAATASELQLLAPTEPAQQQSTEKGQSVVDDARAHASEIVGVAVAKVGDGAN